MSHADAVAALVSGYVDGVVADATAPLHARLAEVMAEVDGLNAAVGDRDNVIAALDYFGSPLHMRLNLHIGPDPQYWGLPNDRATTQPLDFQVDYVRLYALPQ